MNKRFRSGLVLSILLLGGCASTAANEVGLSYGGGIFENKRYQKIIEPGATNTFVGVMDPNYNYRIDQRSWIGRDCSEPDCADRPAVEFVSKDGIRMKAPVDIYFTLRQDEETLRRFHEEIGLKTRRGPSAGGSPACARTSTLPSSVASTQPASRSTGGSCGRVRRSATSSPPRLRGSSRSSWSGRPGGTTTAHRPTRAQKTTAATSASPSASPRRSILGWWRQSRWSRRPTPRRSPWPPKLAGRRPKLRLVRS